jgi:poly(ADP-ribose) glycohydrolase ARH3
MSLDPDRFTGCLLGLAFGDALGAPHEGGVLERCIWRLIGRTLDGRRRWTDDTRMSLDLAESLLAENSLSQDDLARRFAQSYAWSRGYGPSTARLLRRIRRGEPWARASRAIHPEGSWGNGAAMRAPVIALFVANEPERLVEAARASAEVTHAHPLGIEGALLMAVATHALLHDRSAAQVLAAVSAHCHRPEIIDRLRVATAWLAEGTAPGPRQVAAGLGNDMTAATSCVSALYIGLRHLEAGFDTMVRFTIAWGGDVDTLASMAGALWGARNGAARLPAVAIEARERIEDVAARLHRHAELRSSARRPGRP